MNSLPDSLKYDIIDEKPPEPPVKEVVTESDEVLLTSSDTYVLLFRFVDRFTIMWNS